MPRLAPKIICNASVLDSSTEWYGELIVDNIRYEDGTPVTVNKYLGVKFIAPKWTDDLEEIYTDPIDSQTTGVTAKIGFQTSYTFDADDKIIWAINGNLITDSERYTNGTVDVKCASTPDPALAGSTQVVFSVFPGETKSFPVVSEETVVATAQVSPSQVTVKTDETTTLNITYGKVDRYSAMDLHVEVFDSENGDTLADFFSPSDHKTELRRLPSSGVAAITAQIIRNNVKHIAVKTAQLENNLVSVTIHQSDFEMRNIDTPGFVDLPIELPTEFTKPGSTISVHLLSTDMKFVYTQIVDVNTDTHKFSVPVSPGKYNVQTTGFIDDWTVYAVQAPLTLSVAIDGSTKLDLTIRRGANLKVRGFPEFLSFGQDFIDDPATIKTIQLAASVENQLGDGNPVLPVMISYTVNLSGGNNENLKDAEKLAHSFGNLILSLNLATKYGKQSVPAGYINNAAFLGACQQQGLEPECPVPVRESLADALEYRALAVDVPSNITDTLEGYVLEVNWLMRTVAANVTFGWQVNLWGVGSSTNEKYCPDLLVVDRYEADDFTDRGYGNIYCYGPYEWGRFFDFCSELSLELQVPIMPWQIPASRIPNRHDSVKNLEAEQWGTCGTYLFGDDGINTDYRNIHPTILAIELPKILPYDNVEEMFIHAQPFSLSCPAYSDFPLRGIFTVLLGGGSTTGIVEPIGTTGKWTWEKVKDYMETPIPLNKSPPA
ncbi:putative hydroxymethyltransferase [Whalleya microplaca]|nr:putative hydroxymethyltransferase [Whalleya microplaca]